MILNNLTPERLRKFYYLSLFCLIPGFGILIGIYFLFLAVFEFKSIKFFILILVEATLSYAFVAIGSSYLADDLKYGKQTGNLMSTLVIDQLDSIAAKLELYKSKFGEYPDSLEQLRGMSFGLSITDPL